MVSWQAFLSLPPCAPFAPKTHFPFLFKSLPRRLEYSLWNKLFICSRVPFVTFSCCVTIVFPSLLCIIIDSFGVIICSNLVTGCTPPRIFPPCFLEMKIRVSWGYVLNPSPQPVNQFGWNLANLLSDSFSKKLCLRILISCFVFQLEYFFTSSANDLLSLTSTAYNKRIIALDKNLRQFFSQTC